MLMDLTPYAEQIRQQDIEKVADKYLSRSKDGGYICPHCGNGTGKDGTGVKIHKNNFHCFKCGKNFNTLELIAECENLNLKGTDGGFLKAVKIGCDIFGISLVDSPAISAQKKSAPLVPTKTYKPPETNVAELEIIHSDIKAAQNNLETFLQTQGGSFRGLNFDTLNFFGCGYLPEWIAPKNRLAEKNVPSSRRLIIPTPNHYGAILPPADRTDKNKDWWKMHAGTKEIFGADFLPVNSDLILIVEGEIDAMSIWQATGGNFNVIASCGAAETKKVVKLLQDKFPADKPHILILFDSDEAGRKNASNLREDLLKVGVPAVCKFLSNENSKVDANDILQEQGGDKLNDLISAFVESSKEEFSAIADFNKKVEEWKKFNGAIDPATLEELRNSEKYLNSLSAEDITAEIIFNSKRKIALCKVYDFCQSSAESFLAKSKKAVELAKNKIRAVKKDNSLLPFSADVEVLANVSIRDLKANVDKIETQIRKEQKNFLNLYSAKISQQKHEKYLAQQAELNKAREEKIRQLLQAPLTDEVVAEIIENINENLDWLVDKHGMRVKVKATAMNFKKIFCNDPNIKDLFAYDEFQQAIVFAKKPLWKKDSSCVGEMWEDTDDSELRIYLRETYQELAHEQMTYDYLTSYTQKKSFHVVKDFFAGLPKWDGEKRAEELFIKFLRVDDTPYTREITRKFLLAAISRIYHPGCNFQSALVLQGAQSIGKSYVLEKLGSQWHTTLSDNVDDPHAIDAIQNSWLVEIKEFSAARKADVNALKSYLERPADNRRAAYERRAKISKRHCVFAITVNDENFLRDQTGNRRFWILKCKSKMFEIVEGLTDEYIRQVWAEAKQIYDETFADRFDDKKLQLSFENKIRAEEIADQFMQDDGMKGEIEAFLQTKIPYKIIWDLLTKEQRRKFFVDGFITILENDLMALNKNLRPQPVAGLDQEGGDLDKSTEFYYCLNTIDHKEASGAVRFKVNADDKLSYYKFYGVEFRKTICAAEILNECFGNGDRRKSPQKINEILPKIEGWQVGERQKNYSGYGDQKKIFYRLTTDEQNAPDRQDTEPDINDYDDLPL